MTTDPEVTNLENLPRKNGELVFRAPWEGRAFGMAVALTERGSFPWSEFRDQLVTEIGVGDDPAYYQHWLAAFESVVLERGLLRQDELESRAAEFKSGERDSVI